MSIFSKVLKGVAKLGGKALKTGLSIATRGVSDKVLSIAKTIGIGTKKAKAVHPQSLAATVDKIGQMTPRVKQTAYTDISDAPIVIRRKAPKKKKKAAKPRAAKAKAPRSPAKARTAPKGGLDLKRISSMWSAAGKPGKWIDFIKANSNIRKAA